MSKDYVPQNHQKFDTWFKNLTQYVSTKTSGSNPEWTHIPAQERDEFIGAYAQWYPDFSPTLNPDCTKGERNKRDEAMKKSTAIIRPFVQRHLYYKDVTDYDRIRMDLPLRDTTRTHHDTPKEMVEMSIKLKDVRELVVHFKVQGKSNKAKPEGYEGAVLIWAPLEKPPADTSELTRHTMASRTPYVLDFEENERGKVVYISAAWQNNKGDLGKWCEVVTAFVP